MASSYTTHEGDTWDSIALSQLGDERHLGLLLLANPAHAYTQIFDDGTTLVVPDLPAVDPDSSLPPWRTT